MSSNLVFAFFALHVQIPNQYVVWLDQVVNPKSPRFGRLLTKTQIWEQIIATAVLHQWSQAIRGS